MKILKSALVVLLASSGFAYAAEDIDVAMYDEAYINETEVEDIHVAMYDEAYEGLPGNEPSYVLEDNINELPATAAGIPLVTFEDCNG